MEAHVETFENVSLILKWSNLTTLKAERDGTVGGDC